MRRRPPLFRSLGAADPPRQVEIGGQCYRRSQIFKHDSWAATALYWGPGGQVICKFHRQQPIGPVPMKWLGNLLARREITMLQRLAGVRGVPEWRGMLRVEGKSCPHAVAREFVPGQTLGCQGRIGRRFFEDLRRLLDEMHRHEIAYVDLHKHENVLVGEDGYPYLFDFQVSFALPERGFVRRFVGRPLLRIYQRMDRYHFQKHLVKRCAEPVDEPLRVPWLIRLHRLAAVPLRTARRRFLVALGIRGGDGRAHSEPLAEPGLRAAGAGTSPAGAPRRPTIRAEALSEAGSA